MVTAVPKLNTSQKKECSHMFLADLSSYCEKAVSVQGGCFFVKLKQDLTYLKVLQFSDLLRRMNANWVSCGQNTYQITIHERIVNSEIEKNIALRDLSYGPISRLNSSNLVLESLIVDMRKNGQTDAILVRPSVQFSGKYEIIDGHRRYEAATALDWYEISAIVKEETSELNIYEIFFSNNFNRLALNYYDLGFLCNSLMTKFPSEFPKQRELAKKFNLSEALIKHSIDNYIFLRKYQKCIKKENPSLIRLIEKKLAGKAQDAYLIDSSEEDTNKLIVKFLSNAEKKELLDIFLIILGNGGAITPQLIKNAAKTLVVDRTTLTKLINNPHRIPSDETTYKIFKYLFNENGDFLKYNLLTAHRLVEIKGNINRKIDSLFLSIYK